MITVGPLLEYKRLDVRASGCCFKVQRFQELKPLRLHPVDKPLLGKIIQVFIRSVVVPPGNPADIVNDRNADKQHGLFRHPAEIEIFRVSDVFQRVPHTEPIEFFKLI